MQLNCLHFDSMKGNHFSALLMFIFSFGQYAYCINTHREFSAGYVFPYVVLGKENVTHLCICSANFWSQQAGLLPGALLLFAHEQGSRNAADGVCTRYW